MYTSYLSTIFFNKPYKIKFDKYSKHHRFNRDFFFTRTSQRYTTYTGVCTWKHTSYACLRVTFFFRNRNPRTKRRQFRALNIRFPFSTCGGHVLEVCKNVIFNERYQLQDNENKSDVR